MPHTKEKPYQSNPFDYLYGGSELQTKNEHVLRTISKLSILSWKIIYISWIKMSEKLKNDTKILVLSAPEVIDHHVKSRGEKTLWGI